MFSCRVLFGSSVMCNVLLQMLTSTNTGGFIFITTHLSCSVILINTEWGCLLAINFLCELLKSSGNAEHNFYIRDFLISSGLKQLHYNYHHFLIHVASFKHLILVLFYRQKVTSNLRESIEMY